MAEDGLGFKKGLTFLDERNNLCRMESDKRGHARGEGQICFPNLGSLVEITDNFRNSNQMTPSETREVVLRAANLMDPNDLSPLIYRILLGLALDDVRHGVGASRDNGKRKRHAANSARKPIFSGPEDPIFQKLLTRLSSDN